MPLVAPVTSAVLPVRSVVLMVVLSLLNGLRNPLWRAKTGLSNPVLR